MKKIAIVDGVRTPFIKAWDLFDAIPAQRLGAICLQELLIRTGLKAAEVDEVIFGCVGQPIEAPNVARVISLLGGIPKEKRAYTVARNCASGLEAVTSAAEKINAGLDQVVIAGGTESMSNMPLVFKKETATLFLQLTKAKSFGERLKVMSRFRLKHFEPIPSLKLGLSDPTCGLNMGQTAEVLAKEFGMTRQRQDEFAVQSHKKTVAAREKLREEIVPVMIPPAYKKTATDDNGVREDSSLENLAKLKPIFDRHSGTVTAGNSSQVTDGACALLVMEEEKAKALGHEILGTIRAYSYLGLEPSKMGLGPVFAIEEVLRQSSLALKDIELFEINEAFAVQMLACLEAMNSAEFSKKHLHGSVLGEINPDLLNVNGGSIAIGHPVGASGARLVLTCLKEMKRRHLHRGLVSLCIGGGQGGAMILERNS